MSCAKVEEGGDFLKGVCANIWMKARKWEHILIKHSIPRDINTTRSYVEALVAFVGWAIPPEDTRFRSKLNSPRIIGT
jgi:hypothetical protein